MSRARVCTAAELPPGERRVVELDGRTVGVFNVDGHYYAIGGECPHRGGPVCEGQLGRELVAEFVGLGERIEEQYAENPVIACPWHGWEYDLATGVHLGDDRIQLPTFDVVEDDGDLFVEA